MDFDFSKYGNYKNGKQKLKDLETIIELHESHDSTVH